MTTNTCLLGSVNYQLFFRIEFKSFSCYDNFVPSNNAGVPDHTPTHAALHHLRRYGIFQSIVSLKVLQYKRDLHISKEYIAGPWSRRLFYLKVSNCYSLLKNVTTRIKELPPSDLLQAAASAHIPEDIDIEDLQVSLF